MSLLVPIAFAAGVITAFTPCILPVLPIVLAGGTSGSRRRPYAIVAGLVTTFTLFTLAGAWVFHQLHLPARWQIRIGAILLLVLAITLIVPRIGELLERPFGFLTRRRAGDLGGGFVLGASLGLVFVPCGGPVLAAVSANAGTDRVGFGTVVVALAYAVGAALPMLLIAHGSRRFAAVFRARAQTVRVTAGVLMAAAAVVIYGGWAESLQTKVPGYIKPVQDAIERNGSADRQLSRLKGDGGASPFTDVRATSAPPDAFARAPVKVGLRDYGPAPDFQGVSHWLNTQGGRGLSLGDLRGHVVLIDFWTYSCINCLRTLPYLESWDRRYRTKGLTIVGVHTPEFAFEHDLGNVRHAVRRLGVRYPVPLDNDYGTWKAYGNQYWPAEYLIDQTGHVRHVHFGEGEYDETERLIRLLLEAGGASALPTAARNVDRTPSGPLTPETYLGYSRISDRFDSDRLVVGRPYSFRRPPTLVRDHYALGGTWTVEEERAVSGEEATLRLHFYGRKVHLVLGGKGTVVATSGATRRVVHVDGSQLYTLVSEPKNTEGMLNLVFTPGVQAYAFTFG